MTNPPLISPAYNCIPDLDVPAFICTKDPHVCQIQFVQTVSSNSKEKALVPTPKIKYPNPIMMAKAAIERRIHIKTFQNNPQLGLQPKHLFNVSGIGAFPQTQFLKACEYMDIDLNGMIDLILRF